MSRTLQRATLIMLAVKLVICIILAVVLGCTLWGHYQASKPDPVIRSTTQGDSHWLPGERNSVLVRAFLSEVHAKFVSQTGDSPSSDWCPVTDEIARSCPSYQEFTRFQVMYLPPIPSGEYGIVMERRDSGQMIACFSGGDVIFWP